MYDDKLFIRSKNGDRILINADDFGLNPDVNKAVIDLLLANKIQRTTLMVSMPYAEEAVRLAKEHHLEDRVGLHLNIGDGPALTEEMRQSSFCTDGEFNDSYEYIRFARLYLSPSMRKIVRNELDAQFQRYKEFFGHYPEHVDGHRHFHNLLPHLYIVTGLAKRYGVKSMRIGINLYDYKTAGLFKKAYKWFINRKIRSQFESTDYMGAYLEYIDYYQDTEDKTIEIMVHPTYKDGRYYDIIFENKTQRLFDFDDVV